MGKKRVLIIEDDPAIAEIITYALNTEGFVPIWRQTGKEGLDTISTDNPDLIIIDIGLPDICGTELCKKVRGQLATPIIFLTARSSEIDKVVGLEIGADDYITKPFSPRELTARIKAILRRTEPSEPAHTNNGSSENIPFTLDEEKFQITYFNEGISFSRYEYRILKSMIQRPGRVFSRDQLMDIAWEEPAASFDRTVDTHIKTIRSKLKAIKAEFDPIITHRGLGYSLREDW